MEIDRITNSSLLGSICIIGDLHINSNISEDFERARLQALSKRIKWVLRSNPTAGIILAGDTFDRNSPSLVDIKLFYEFTESITGIIYVIAGNHDQTVFEYLPQTSFTYLQKPTVLNGNLMLVGHPHIKDLILHLGIRTYLDTTLISHARCTIPPYIAEEIPIEILSKSFKQVVLGDIHTQPTLPFDNVIYTTSPSNITFTKLVEGAHGFIVYHQDTQSIEWKSIDIPSKQLVTFETPEEVIAFYKLPADSQLTKVRFKGHADIVRALGKLSRPNTISDFVITSGEITRDCDKDQVQTLSTFLSSKVDISEYAFKFFKNALGRPEEVIDGIHKSWKELRVARGSHR